MLALHQAIWWQRWDKFNSTTCSRFTDQISKMSMSLMLFNVSQYHFALARNSYDHRIYYTGECKHKLDICKGSNYMPLMLKHSFKTQRLIAIKTLIK